MPQRTVIECHKLSDGYVRLVLDDGSEATFQVEQDVPASHWQGMTVTVAEHDKRQRYDA